MRKLLFIAVLLIGACHKGDGAILVAVGATQPVSHVATLHVTMTVGSAVHTHDVSLGAVNIDDAHKPTFGIDVSADLGSMMDLHVDAQDSMGRLLASGARAGIAIAAGRITSATLELGMPSCTVDKTTIDNCVIAQ
jgi:hypothetical protein